MLSLSASWYFANSNKVTTSPFNNPVGIFGDSIDHSNATSRNGGWRTVELTTSDGINLHNLWIHADTRNATSGRPKKVPVTILYFHGNADRIVSL